MLDYATPTARPPIEWPRTLLRGLAAIFFAGAGINHFINPTFYRQIIPPGFPSPATLVAVSGVCEIAGGLGLLHRPLRKAAGLGLIALLIAVFPANIYMAAAPDRIPDLHIPRWMLWTRLPLQVVMIAWVWYASRNPPNSATNSQMIVRE